ncbi:efflux RND transporter periplasmic adaptor subunit [Cohnella lupini]|uniref:Macrolide-specific efflux system membrane fusion protein n=1 Tax=Cohnella lupini TaxID=1294267 RepID=A0A3D9IVT8_9BACL|nr:efflux RND transporter periplasmic adaptor subunit [Cohnella lupini]RED65832.1 macrolide-specific efflux system membrane fusion protein [Cohnella lupini]
MSMKWWTAYSSANESMPAKRRNRKRAGLLAVLSLSIAITGCSMLPSEPEEEDLSGIQLPQISEKPKYDVTTKTLETTAQGSGKIMSTQEKQLYFTLDGKRLKKLYIQTGDKVETGQTIGELDVDDMKKTLRSQNLAFRKTELTMKETLRKKDEMDPIEFEQALLSFEEAKQALTDAQEDIDKAVLTSPFSGTVVSVAVQEGAQIKAYDTIVTIANPSSLIVAASLSKEDLERIALGMEVLVDINNAGQVKGTIKQFPVPADPQNGGNGGGNGQGGGNVESISNYLLIDVKDLPKTVTRGTPLSVTVIVNRKENAVVIPLAALRTIGARTYVQVVEADGSKREVDVEVGQQTSTDAEILNGLTPGQKVVGR